MRETGYTDNLLCAMLTQLGTVAFVAWGMLGMDCGGDDLICQGMTWLEHNEFIASTMAELISHLGAQASGIIGVIATFLQHNAQAIFGAAGLAFGIWRWWRYREQILHKRLAEYLRDSDSRLKEGQHYVLNALQRPGPGQPFSLPLFASDQLRSVLRERNWDKSATALQVASSAEWQLSQALEKIQRQMISAEDTITSLRRQYATAHILRGAIASSMAKRNPALAAQKNNIALTEFRTVLQIPGHKSDLAAKEFEAHQLRKLGHLDDALEAYQALEEMASTIEDQRDQIILIASAKRYQAEILQARSTMLDLDGKQRLRRCDTAFNLVSSSISNSALDIRKRFAPYQGWDLLEEGDINYLVALISNVADFRNREADHLRNARTAYHRVIAELPRRRAWRADHTMRLRKAAEAGLERVNCAENKIYDSAWLMSS